MIPLSHLLVPQRLTRTKLPLWKPRNQQTQKTKLKRRRMKRKQRLSGLQRLPRARRSWKAGRCSRWFSTGSKTSFLQMKKPLQDNSQMTKSHSDFYGCIMFPEASSLWKILSQSNKWLQGYLVPFAPCHLVSSLVPVRFLLIIDREYGLYATISPPSQPAGNQYQSHWCEWRRLHIYQDGRKYS